MTTSELYNELNYVNHSREKRRYYAELLIEHPKLISKTLEILFCVDDKISPRAAWILEFMCKENLDELIPYLDEFTKNMQLVYLDAAVRPVAKICEYLATSYFSKHPNAIKDNLSETHKNHIIEVCFDYLISDQKIAPKAYAMQTLYLFGKEFPWIHPELASILRKDYSLQSSGFKARAKQILKKIDHTSR